MTWHDITVVSQSRAELHSGTLLIGCSVPTIAVHQQVAEVVPPVSFVSCQTPPTLRCLKTRGAPPSILESSSRAHWISSLESVLPPVCLHTWNQTQPLWGKKDKLVLLTFRLQCNWPKTAVFLSVFPSIFWQPLALPGTVDKCHFASFCCWTELCHLACSQLRTTSVSSANHH